MEYSLDDLYKMGMPQIEKAVVERHLNALENHIFFETVKPGERRCVCSACQKTFTCGTNTVRRTDTPELRALDKAHHHEKAVCPYCKKTITVINSKIQRNKLENIIRHSSYTTFFAANGKDDVWIIGVCFTKEYYVSGRTKGEADIQDAYHYTPGAARHFKRSFNRWYGWNDNFYSYRFSEPFAQNFGLKNYSFPYSSEVYGNLGVEDTFLKYSGFEAFNKERPNVPHEVYLGWYAIHPQIEMLSKFGQLSVIDDMIYNDTENKRIVNWNAKTPWELFRLTKPLYKTWVEKYRANLTVLKVFKRLKTDKEKDFKTAETLLNFTWHNLGEVYSLIKSLRGFGKSPQEAIKYFEYISRRSGGMCHNCIGITPREAFNTWKDYISMSNTGSKTFSPFPANLKAAHDNLIARKKAADKKAAAKQCKAEAKRKAAQVEKKYKNADKNLKSIKDKYYYDNGKYVFIPAQSVYDILYDGLYLGQCTARPDAGGKYWRYFDRINKKESYIGFVRKSKKPDEPWFTVEYEPGGTVRQKRSYDDSQPAGTTPLVVKFLTEWQEQLAPKLGKKEKTAAARSKVLRSAEFEELRRQKKKIYYGPLAGQLLVTALEKDLIEAKEEKGA